jgi:hypothetical protein
MAAAVRAELDEREQRDRAERDPDDPAPHGRSSELSSGLHSRSGPLSG